MLLSTFPAPEFDLLPFGFDCIHLPAHLARGKRVPISGLRELLYTKAADRLVINSVREP